MTFVEWVVFQSDSDFPESEGIREDELMTEEIEKRLPALGTHCVPGLDDIAQVKFVMHCTQWIWLATQYDPEDQVFYGFVCGLAMEWGEFGLLELDGYRGDLGQPVERDCDFQPKPIKNVLYGGYRLGDIY